MSLVVCGDTVLLSGICRRAVKKSGVACRLSGSVLLSYTMAVGGVRGGSIVFLRYSSGLVVIMADLEVLKGWLKNEQLLLLTLLINLCTVCSKKLWISFVRMFVQYFLPTSVSINNFTYSLGYLVLYQLMLHK